MAVVAGACGDACAEGARRLAGVRIDNANLSGARIDNAFIKGMTIYGIEIEPLLVKERERRAAKGGT
jgi:uncharacterized protein YjbI with pentapeptide repeats